MKYIELKAVSKAFKDTRDKTINVLNKCNMYIEKGESIGILGANGSGKSTLLKIISGSESVSSGERIVKGNISWPVGVYSALLPNLTVDQNVNLIGDLMGVNKAQLLDRVLSLSGLTASKYQLVSSLSSGMRAKLGFFLVISIDFDFFIFDEVAAVGDKDFQKTYDLYLQNIKNNSGYILCSHAKNKILNQTDKCYVLKNNKLSEKMDTIDAIKYYED